MANPISWQQAQQNVQTFLQQRGKRITAPSLHQVPMPSPMSCYIFNIGDNEGYVIAAADDCSAPILGYSDEGAFDLDNIPDNMRWWLEELTQPIQLMCDKGLASPRVARKSPSQPAIDPMLTTLWHQSPPYNQACPLDTNGRRCVAGCVATAMAQVLYYHRARSVSHTTHEMPAYVTERGVNVDAIPAGSIIDWDNMLDRYANNIEVTPEQQAAVANLMCYCGTSIQSKYSSISTSGVTASVAKAMIAYFNYTSKTEAIHRNTCGLSDDEWENLIYHELSNSRPVIYSGYTKNNNGHAFVCDGYDGEGFFHFNWGSGMSGSYCLLTAIDSIGTSLINYSLNQCAIIHAEPRPVIPNPEDGIQFADPITRALCLHDADVDDDGTVTMEEASAITTMGPYKGAWMSSFDEFRFFTGMTTISREMFLACNQLESITLHDAVTDIEVYAFGNCSSLKEITIPYSVTSIGTFAFTGCSSLKHFIWNAKNCSSTLTNVITKSVEWLTIGDSVEAIPNSFAKNTKIKKLTLGKSIIQIPPSAFYNCNELQSVVMSDSVRNIGNSAFFGNSNLETLILSKSLAEIGEKAFDMCSSLKHVAIPDSVTNIGKNAFYNCTQLESVVIGKSVTAIGNYAFSGCNRLKTVTCLLPQPITIQSNVFNNLYNKAVLRVPADAVEDYKATSPWNMFSVIIGIDPSDGDVNLDGVVNISDVIALIDQVLMGNDTDFGDVNNDGSVNITDVTILISKLLSGSKA